MGLATLGFFSRLPKVGKLAARPSALSGRNIYNDGAGEVEYAMRQAEEGIHVPRKMLIWMIFASVFINVLFLLMGMVIGKEDFLRQKVPIPQGEAGEQASAAQAEDPLALELSHYEGMANKQPPAPADVSYLAVDPSVSPTDTPAPAEDQEPGAASADPIRSSEAPSEAAEPPSEPAEDQIVRQGENGSGLRSGQAQREEVMEPVRPADPHPADRGAFFVQVMASKDPGKVKSMEQQLKSMGYRTFLLEGGGLTRICIGYFSAEGEAGKAKVRVDGEFKLSSQVKKR
jgi:cell division septation protein DedD